VSEIKQHVSYGVLTNSDSISLDEQKLIFVTTKMTL
jgi:hypothetical protein